MGALEPILPILLMDSIQTVDLKDLVAHLAQTVQKSSFQVSAITQFKHLDFINIGKRNLFFKVFNTVLVFYFKYNLGLLILLVTNKLKSHLRRFYK